MFLYIYIRSTKEFTTVPAFKVPLFKQDKYALENKYFVQRGNNGAGEVCNVLLFAKTKKELDDKVHNSRRSRIPAEKTLHSVTENSTDDENSTNEQLQTVPASSKANCEKIQLNLQKRLQKIKLDRLLKRCTEGTSSHCNFDEDYCQETPPKKPNIISASEEASQKCSRAKGNGFVNPEIEEIDIESPASQKCSRAKGNGFVNPEIEEIDIESPPSWPQIVSQEIFMPGNLKENWNEKIDSNVPLQNITNKFPRGAHENLPDKQICTLKKIQNEKAKSLEKENDKNLKIKKNLQKYRNQQTKPSAIEKNVIHKIQENTIVQIPERINSGTSIQQKDIVNVTSLKYSRSIQEFKQQIHNLNKELYDKTKECERLQKIVSQKDKEIERIRQLNENLQKCCINSADEIKILLEQSNRSLNGVQNNGYLPSGYIKKDESKIHLGRDVWISTDCYYIVVSNIRSNAIFVRNLAVAVFGEELLTKCTLSGRGSNRNKQTKKPEGGKLDERKVLAIKDFYRYWLMTERGMNDIEADMEATKTFDYIRKKIADMKTVPRGDGKTRGETQEEERESDENDRGLLEEVRNFAQSLNESDENDRGLPEEVRSFAQSLNEDHNRNQNEDHNGNQNENQNEDEIEETEMEIEAAIREDDKFPDEAEPTVEDQEGLSDDEEKRQEGMEASLPNWESCRHPEESYRHPEQTMQFSAQNAVLKNKI